MVQCIAGHNVVLLCVLPSMFSVIVGVELSPEVAHLVESSVRAPERLLS